jgi:hypothetical protein
LWLSIVDVLEILSVLSHIDEPGLVFDIGHFDRNAAILAAFCEVLDHLEDVVINEVGFGAIDDKCDVVGDLIQSVPETYFVGERDVLIEPKKP